ncbi:MAG: tetratricopeptide repeat protein [Kofleriaceae bacterium]|nr:tetratricopeptide repeat protein [Kofleriaceae bacterium]
MSLEPYAEMYQRLVRGDALIGILPLAEVRQAVTNLWDLATHTDDAGTWLLLGRYYVVHRHPQGAFDGTGVDVPAAPAWPRAVATDVPEDDPFGVAVRCFAHAAGKGSLDAAILLARCARETDAATRATARALLSPFPDSGGTLTYERAVLAYWDGDLGTSIALHTEAAQAGHIDAMFELYCLYAKGEGVEADEAKAQRWLERAADGGHGRAVYNVGAAYASGRGVERDAAKAITYYERAANLGNARAAAMLGYMFLVGEGAEASPERASEWFDDAEAMGFDVEDFCSSLGIEDPRT